MSECISWKLGKVYQGRPQIPVIKFSIVKYPLERLHMDLTGPLVGTERGHKLTLVTKDYLTKFAWLFAITSKKAEEIAERLVEFFLCLQNS